MCIARQFYLFCRHFDTLQLVKATKSHYTTPRKSKHVSHNEYKNLFEKTSDQNDKIKSSCEEIGSNVFLNVQTVCPTVRQ